ncbi:MAG: hydroxyacylglutathione hydrolase [Sphingobacteriia bacterium]|nr:hydroxyacylglutathione hydrolase [Sphingobacteriia bacterium]NCC38978.1 hydroxyacylglutathione hydrolase [Gammaproteobacteria bacterium]
MIEIRPISAFDDNYIWLLTEAGAPAVVVDPGDADPVLAHLRAEGRPLGAVLITHHHGDHTGGVSELREAFPDLRVYGPRDRRIPEVTDAVGEGDQVCPAGLGSVFRVMAVPGHTSTHIAYLGAGALFCGDTLFAGGCGRVFDGTFEQLAGSLDRIAALPGETLVYCAHEYTLANLGFARWVEPERPALTARIAAEQARRAQGRPTVPSRLDLECATNPFLRTRVPAVIHAAECFTGQTLTPGAEVFKALRVWKDTRYD